MQPTESAPSRTEQKWGPLAEPIHHDYPNIQGGALPWRENAFVSWWDVKRRCYGVAHFSTTPNGKGARARASIGVGDRQAELIEPLPWGTMSTGSFSVDLEHDIRVEHDVGPFSFVRNAAGLLAGATVELRSRSLTLTVVDKLGGFWNPLGADRSTGPTCSVYDEFLVLNTGDGRSGSALCEHGIVRKVI